MKIKYMTIEVPEHYDRQMVYEALRVGVVSLRSALGCSSSSSVFESLSEEIKFFKGQSGVDCED